MGATIRMTGGYVEAETPRLRGATIRLDVPAVGATEQLLMAGTLAAGTTVIENAAREPEIDDLAAALTRMGARISEVEADRCEFCSATTSILLLAAAAAWSMPSSPRNWPLATT